MRFLIKQIGFAIGILGLPIASFAQFTAITDDFSVAGNLTGSTPDSGVGNWTTNNSSTPALTVSSGILNIAGGSGESSQVNFASSNLSSGTIYMGFDFMVSSSGTINTSPSIQAVAGFRSGTASASGAYAVSFGAFRPNTNAQTASGSPSTTTSQVVVGLFTDTSFSADSSNLTEWSTVLNRGQTYRVVLSFDLSNDTASLWINPNSSSSTSVTITGITADARGVFFRQGAATHGDISIDNLAVSQTFDIASAVPEPATYALFGGLSVLGLAAFRRRHTSRLASAP